MPQVYNGLVQAAAGVGPAIAEGFAAGQERRYRRDLGAALAGGDLEAGAAMAFGQGDIQTGMGLQNQLAGRQTAQREAQEAREEMMREAAGQFAPAIANAANIEDDEQRAEALALITMQAQQLYPDLGDDLVTVGAQLANLPPDQLRIAAQAWGAETEDASPVNWQRFEGINPETGRSEFGQINPRTGEVRWAGVQSRPRQSRDININLPDQTGGPAPQFLTQDQVAEAGLDPGLYQYRYDNEGNLRIERFEDGEPEDPPNPDDVFARSLYEYHTGGSQIEDLERALELSNIPGAVGPGSGATGAIAGSPAAEIRALLASVTGNIALERLEQMRAMAAEQGQRGSGLGQVTEREIKILEAARGALSQDLSPEQFRRSATRILGQLRQERAERMRILQQDFPEVYARIEGRTGSDERSIDDLLNLYD